VITHSILVPPLDPSINYPRDLRAAMFALVDQVEDMNKDLRELADTLELCPGRRQRAQLERMVTRWEDRRAKLRLFYDHYVLADIKAPA
jgi:Flp pilus assembly CpaE family ATPase